MRMKVSTYLHKEPVLVPMTLLLALIWILPHTSLFDFVEQEIQRQYEQLPAVKIDLHPHRTWMNRFSPNRTVLYIETRNEITHITPLLLHMMQVVPPEWRFVLLATPQIIERVNTSSPVRRMKDTGKLRVGDVTRWTSKWAVQNLPINEVHSRLLTNLTFYDEQLPGVENLLVFRSSAIICANSERTVNDYLHYDWVGAPWTVTAGFGGNGGLSLRKVSKVREVLNFQTRLDETESEDRWLSSRIGLLPNANNANATVSGGFSVEDIWNYEPMGYHINPGLTTTSSPDVWALSSNRKEIYDYCPEIKIILPMRLERERCPEFFATNGGFQLAPPMIQSDDKDFTTLAYEEYLETAEERGDIENPKAAKDKNNGGKTSEEIVDEQGKNVEYVDYFDNDEMVEDDEDDRMYAEEEEGEEEGADMGGIGDGSDDYLDSEDVESGNDFSHTGDLQDLPFNGKV